MKEKDIIYEEGGFWIGKDFRGYTVYRVTITHSVPDSSYELSSDGLSIAMARCRYLAGRSA